MTDIVRQAARHTHQIIAGPDLAIHLLSGFDHPRGNALGGRADPDSYLLALRSAREAIDRAITEHGATR